MGKPVDEDLPTSIFAAADGTEDPARSDGPTDPIARFDRFGLLAEDLDETDDTDQAVPSLLLLGVALHPLARTPLVSMTVRGKDRPIHLSRDRDGWIAEWGAPES